MSNPNLLKVYGVYGEGRRKYGSRQKYIDANGKRFYGTHTEATEHYRALYPTMSIKIYDYPKKREKQNFR